MTFITPGKTQNGLALLATVKTGGSVYVQPYNKTQSPLQVLTNASLFCAEPMMRCATLPNGTRPASHCQKDPTRPAWNPFEAYCPPGDGSSTAGQTPLEDAPGFTMSAAQFYADDKLGGHGPPNPFDSAWTSVPVEAGDDQASVKIDLAGVNGTVVRPDFRAVPRFFFVFLFPLDLSFYLPFQFNFFSSFSYLYYNTLHAIFATAIVSSLPYRLASGMRGVLGAIAAWAMQTASRFHATLKRARSCPNHPASRQTRSWQRLQPAESALAFLRKSATRKTKPTQTRSPCDCAGSGLAFVQQELARSLSLSLSLVLIHLVFFKVKCTQPFLFII